MTFHI